MPPVRFVRDDKAPQLWRIFLNGAPGMWKTTSLLELPPPRGIVVSPGEKQHRVIPDNDPETIAFRFLPERDSHSMIQVVEYTCMELIAGKYGKLQSLAFDGFHKMLEYFMDSITDGAWSRGEEFDEKLYALGYRSAERFLTRIQDHMIPWVVVTSWDGDKADRKARPNERPTDVPTHIRPGLIGQMSRRIMGEFPVILHAAKRKPDPTMQKRWGYPSDKEVVMWQTRPYGEVHGASIRGRKEIVEKIPDFIPASYATLESLWAQAETPNPKETH